MMPQITEQLNAELPHLDDGTLEDGVVGQMLEDLPQIVPNAVRRALSRRRRNI
jgi:hypothetical protein